MDDETDWYEKQRHDSKILHLAIVINAEDRHIGAISLMKIDQRSQNSELGIAIGDKDYWGYGQEAIKLLINFGFHHHNLHRIYLRVNADHVAGKHLSAWTF
jgi:RimJ/RimL family protein N-acetyltransferase